MSTKCPLAKFLQLIVKIYKKKLFNYSKYKLKWLLTKDPSETSSL